jgi:hypothetical protein
MKNWDKNEEQIRNIGVGNLAMDFNGNLFNCRSTSIMCCDKCLFRKKAKEKKTDKVNCQDIITDWLYQEYKEPYKLTILELNLLQYLKDNKFTEISRSEGGCIIFGTLCKEALFSSLFQFIKRSEIYKIEEILNNYEVVEK